VGDDDAIERELGSVMRAVEHDRRAASGSSSDGGRDDGVSSEQRTDWRQRE
jgi:hypothetical protein